MTPPELVRRGRRVVISGGAGFIGTNLADRLLREGTPVLIYDDLSRSGVEQNLQWLCDRHGALVAVEVADVRDAAALRRAVNGAAMVVHLAAQVAVTHSLEDPVRDFEINVRGTLNVLEAVRHAATPPAVVFTSTNKVYGDLADVALECTTRYQPQDADLRARGISEARPLDFHSPYGCSKGAADQYVLDYARSYGLSTMVFRMSCIYGPHQHGTEDQGWVAHFLIRALAGRPITIYGDGRQVRDLLFVEDLVEALLLAQRHMPTESGQAFNIGGGPANAVSLLEVIEAIARLTDRPPTTTFDAWRLGDQRYYVSDSGRFAHATGWRPTVGVPEGLSRLASWLKESGRMPALAANTVGPS
jgi:CDP-paratose 2-epimerase